MLEKARARQKNKLSYFTILLKVYKYKDVGFRIFSNFSSNRNSKADLNADVVFLISATST